MQTFIVHNRNPRQVFREMGAPAAIVFEMLTLGMIVAPLLHVGHFLALLLASLLGLPIWPSGLGWSAIYVLFLGLGYGSALAMTALGLARLRRLDLLVAQCFLPLYWLLMAWATIRALVELARQPFYWFKSPHTPDQQADVCPPRSAGRPTKSAVPPSE